MKLPGFMFYPGDWLKDADLRRCSHAAKGVWTDMLCLMFECEERGVLATAGRAWSDDEIAQAVGGDKLITLSCITELVEKRVASRNASQAVYSRRMVREEQERKANAERIRRHRGREPSVTPPVTQKKRSRTERESEDENEKNTPKGEGVGRGNGKLFSEAKAKLAKLYGREPEDYWTYSEESMLSELTARPQFNSELSVLIRFYESEEAADRRFFPNSLFSLLQKWSETLDRAKMKKKARPLSIMEQDLKDL